MREKVGSSYAYDAAAFVPSAVIGSAAEELMVCRLFAGGNRIRTIGPALVKGLSAVADERCRTDKPDGVIKHRSSRETTMVGRGACGMRRSKPVAILRGLRWLSRPAAT